MRSGGWPTVALTRGMQRVAVTHVGYRGSFAHPSPFIEDIPAGSRVTGWLWAQKGRSLLDPVRRPLDGRAG